MKSVLRYLKQFLSAPYQPRKQVALVLSGGGAKGWAHIGAIKSLIANGYSITSVAGTSMGALIGGLYAAGKLTELEHIANQLTRMKMIKLFGFSPGFDHIVSGEHLMQLFNELIADVCIEELPIPFCCSASDLVSGKEVVFRKGSLKHAIRSSISIPMFFKPISDGKHCFVDGSVHNTLPLDSIERVKNDLLVAVNVSGPNKYPDTCFLQKKTNKEKTNTLKHFVSFAKPDWASNYMNVAARVMQLTIQNNTEMALRLTPPDIYANIPMDEYGMFDFEKSRKLIDYGKQTMDKVLQGYLIK